MHKMVRNISQFIVCTCKCFVSRKTHIMIYDEQELIYYLEKTCLTAAQDQKGLTLSSILRSCTFCYPPVRIKASSGVCVMLQCFPALIFSKFKPIVELKHRCNPILVLSMKRIQFFTNVLIETQAQPNPSFVYETYFVFYCFTLEAQGTRLFAQLKLA